MTMVLLGAFAFYLHMETENARIPILYSQNTTTTKVSIHSDERPFASKNGKTYTYSWCQNSSVILAKNRIYFKNEQAAQASGRTLSKLCQR